jgi:hypothetical protein
MTVQRSLPVDIAVARDKRVAFQMLGRRLLRLLVHPNGHARLAGAVVTSVELRFVLLGRSRLALITCSAHVARIVVYQFI